MDRKDYIIRRETPADYRAAENLTRDAFWNVYRPGCTEHYVLHQFRQRPEFIPELDLVMEKGGEIIGHIMYVRSHISSDSGLEIPTATFGPISISPEYQKMGYGKALLDFSLERAAALNFGAICIEGDIGFYGKSGFIQANSAGLRYYSSKDGEAAPLFLCRELKPGFLSGVTGTYRPPSGYFVDESRAEAFDALFPPKEKLRLPGQLF